MKATFLYSNGKTFTVSGVIENSVNIHRVCRKGLPDLVTVTYGRLRNISSDVISGVLANILQNPVAAANGISSTFEAEELLCGLEGVERVTIPATENGLLYILLKEQENEDCYIAPSVFETFDNDRTIKPVVIIPVLDKRLDSLVIADCISCMI